MRLYSMKLNYFTQQLSVVGRWITTALLCVSAIVFVWQGAFISNTIAMASPATNLIASADAGDRVQEATREGAKSSKNFVRDAADRVEQTARNNASRVEDATDGDNNFIQRKAQRDTVRIHQRAEEDAARTQKAIDNSKNVVERAVDSVKDAFSN